ncbi:MAG: PLP-dependent lyase/thiolase [Acidimicrobiaceae bacterium]|nr:PLP-dependent lyase/thiolase [Acidimicrobiaceae bacterium]
MDLPTVAGWRCPVCGAHVDIASPLQWRCPRAGDGRHHTLELVTAAAPLRPTGDADPFVAFRHHLAWDAYAAALGLTDDARQAIVRDLDTKVASVAGTGFRTTPFVRADALSTALGFDELGGVWVKDETGNVGGSHKARHLFTILLHLVTTELAGRAPWSSPAARPPLAIASCGNAALAAGTLAAAVGWPIRVFVPVAANAAVVARLHELHADVVTCPRLDTDPPGDPCVLRFREAVAAGAVPFGVQGPENAWCLDGGRTIGWELAVAMDDIDASPFDRLFVQVGGGAFAACVAAGLAEGGRPVRLHAVQTEHCAPLERAWQRSFGVGGPAGAAAHWDECMWPWEHVGASAADGILDDETYDWIPIVRAMAATGGAPVVVSEAQVLEANDLLRASTSIDASATGTAGLAGLLAVRDQLDPGERVVVIASGVRR